MTTGCTGSSRRTSPLYRLLTPVKVVGAEHLPADGPVIVAANHISFFDTVVLMLSVPRKTYFVGKAEYMDSWTTSRLFPAMGLIPIERDAAKQAVAALGVAADVLRRGHVLGIYPEGTRSRDGLLHKGHTGVAQLALMTGAPIVPVGLVGTDRIQPIGSKVPRPYRQGRDPLRSSARPGRVRRLAPTPAPADDRRPDGVGPPPHAASRDVRRLRERRAAADPRRHRERLRDPADVGSRRVVAPGGAVRRRRTAAAVSTTRGSVRSPALRCEIDDDDSRSASSPRSRSP